MTENPTNPEVTMASAFAAGGLAIEPDGVTFNWKGTDPMKLLVLIERMMGFKKMPGVVCKWSAGVPEWTASVKFPAGGDNE